VILYAANKGMKIWFWPSTCVQLNLQVTPLSDANSLARYLRCRDSDSSHDSACYLRASAEAVKSKLTYL